MTSLIVCSFGLIATVVAATRGVGRAFGWVFVPTLILVPARMVFDLPGLPDLTPGRAACLGLVLGAAASGRLSHLLPKWQWIDAVALAPVLSFAVSYGLVTDFKGFYHQLPILVLDWGCPYVFARAVLTNRSSLVAFLRPFCLSACLLGLLAMYESRMAFRLALYWWNLIGAEIPPLSHYGSWRWGFLRAHVIYGSPIQLGTVLAFAAPLSVLWGLLEPRYRRMSLATACACAGGCVASLSRGPILVLLASAALFSVLARPRRSIVLAAIALVLAAAPFLVDVAAEEVQYTSQRVAQTGNTAGESGHYRIALLLIYGKEIANVGWWGDRSLVGMKYEEAWSIDNAYLYLFLVGGWLGGGTICLLILLLFYRTAKRLLSSRGPERQCLAAGAAAFAGITGCMCNVWFAYDYAPFLWICAALLHCALANLPSQCLTTSLPSAQTRSATSRVPTSVRG